MREPLSQPFDYMHPSLPALILFIELPMNFVLHLSGEGLTGSLDKMSVSRCSLLLFLLALHLPSSGLVGHDDARFAVAMMMIF